MILLIFETAMMADYKTVIVAFVVSEWRASGGQNVRRNELGMCHLLLYILMKSIAGMILELTFKMCNGRSAIP